MSANSDRELRLQQKILRQLARLNAEISIRDLVVEYDYRDSFGESEMDEESVRHHQLQRLLTHIQLLFNLCNEEHRAHLAWLSNSPMPQRDVVPQNTITRLLMNEFSLYTYKPLSIEDYQCLLAELFKRANDLEPNVHIQLGSLAYLNQENSLVSVTLYIEGGNLPILRESVKKNPSYSDQDYAHPLYSLTAEMGSSATIASIGSDGLYTPLGSLFMSETLGGARLMSALDICMDHHCGNAKEQFVKLLNAPVNGLEDFLSLNVEHLISSNHMDVQEERVISTSVVNASPRELSDDYCPRPRLNGECLERLKPLESAETSITVTEQGYEVRAASFGMDFGVHVYPERSAGQPHGPLNQSVTQHNYRVLESLAKKYQLSLTPSFLEMIADIGLTTVSQHDNELKNELLARLKLNINSESDCRFWQEQIREDGVSYQGKRLPHLVSQLMAAIDGNALCSYCELKEVLSSSLRDSNQPKSCFHHQPLESESVKALRSAPNLETYNIEPHHGLPMTLKKPTPRRPKT